MGFLIGRQFLHVYCGVYGASNNHDCIEGAWGSKFSWWVGGKCTFVQWTQVHASRVPSSPHIKDTVSEGTQTHTQRPRLLSCFTSWENLSMESHMTYIGASSTWYSKTEARQESSRGFGMFLTSFSKWSIINTVFVLYQLFPITKSKGKTSKVYILASFEKTMHVITSKVQK